MNTQCLRGSIKNDLRPQEEEDYFIKFSMLKELQHWHRNTLTTEIQEQAL